MEAEGSRQWLFAVSVSLTVFVLLVAFNVAALDTPLSEAWMFPAIFTVLMLAVKGFFIQRKS